MEMMPKGKARRGAYAAAITPVNAKGGADIDKLVAYCQRLIAEGLTGVAPAGTTGEGNSIPTADRLAMPARFRDAGFASDQVIFGTGACSAADAAILTRASLASGFPSVLVLPPFYMKNVPDDGLYAYYAEIIERIGDPSLRIYLYHFPQTSMVPISLPLIERLKKSFGAVIAGLKDSSGNYEGTLAFQRSAEDFDVFPSNEAVLLDGLAKGCAGVISATTNASAALCGQALAGGADAAKAQEALADIRKAIAAHPLSPAIKQIEAWKSGDDSWNRLFPPLVPLAKEPAQKLRADLQAIEERFGVKLL